MTHNFEDYIQPYKVQSLINLESLNNCSVLVMYFDNFSPIKEIF